MDANTAKESFTLTTLATLLSDEFEAQIWCEHRVKIIDKSRAPFEVVFQGASDDLCAMYRQHWADDDMPTLQPVSQ